MRFLLLIISLLALQACAPNQDKISPVNPDRPVKIKNPLNACISVIPIGQETHDNEVLQTVEINLYQPIAYCGCVSAQLTVYSDLENTLETSAPSLPLAQNTITVTQSGTHKLKLGTIIQLAKKPDMVLGFQCKGPV